MRRKAQQERKRRWINKRPIRVSDHLLIHNRCARWTLRLIALLLPRSKSPSHISSPKRILICNGAHLGDVVIATSILPVIKHAFPDAQLGFLIGSWSKPILDRHPLVDFVHSADHWKLNRAPISLLKKVWIYAVMRKQALKEIRALKYDIAIDLYVFFPNVATLLWRANIPVRLGYTSGGCGSLYTHALEWTHSKEPLALYHFNLLRLLPIGIFVKDLLYPTLAPIAAEAKDAIPTLPFVIFHLGPPASPKAWDPQKWRTLAQRLSREGKTILFTGHGKEEHAQAETIRARIPHTLNYCDQLSWHTFVACIETATVIVTIDSVPVHIADAVNTPVVVLFCSIHQDTLFRPRHTAHRLLVHPSPENVYQALGGL